MKKVKKPEAIIKEIESAKERASALAIKKALTVIKTTGKITSSDIKDIAEKESYKYFEMNETEQQEVADAAYSNTVSYLKECKNLAYIDSKNKLYKAFCNATPVIDDPMVRSLTDFITEYETSLDIAKEEGDIKAQLQALRMITALTTALRIRAKNEDNVKMWLRKVMPTSDQYRLVDNDITFAGLHDKLINDISICSTMTVLNQMASGLILAELIDRYGKDVKDAYDKQYYNYIIRQYANRAS